MTFDHEVAVEECAAAELRGDWASAFEHHRSVPMFAESGHGAMLHVLADLGDDAPRWLVTRFLTVMARRLEVYGQPRRAGRVLEHVVPLIYPHSVPMEVIGCQHPQQVAPFIYARDWVVRQADVYDLGGLEDLLVVKGVEGAVARGERVEEWLDAPMGGYQVLRADGEVMTVADALTGDEMDLLDLGLTAQHPVGTHVLGRVVPTDTGPGRLFDAQPLPVDVRIAREVATRPEEWLEIVSARARSRALPPGFAHLEDPSMSADLPKHAWVGLLGDEIGAPLRRPPQTMVAQALKAALTLPEDTRAASRHLVSELLLDELLDDRTLARFATPTYRDAWTAIAAVVPRWARRRCQTALWMIDAVSSDDLAG